MKFVYLIDLDYELKLLYLSTRVLVGQCSSDTAILFLI